MKRLPTTKQFTKSMIIAANLYDREREKHPMISPTELAKVLEYIASVYRNKYGSKIQ